MTAKGEQEVRTRLLPGRAAHLVSACEVHVSRKDRSEPLEQAFGDTIVMGNLGYFQARSRISSCLFR